MDDKKNIDYSAADIERYHKRLMTSVEMHALERAALDDPFLADAIEGYAAVPVNAEDDISLLNKKMSDRIDQQKMIPFRKSAFPWLRVAALFIVLVGVGLLGYTYLLQHTNKQEVAAIEKKDTATTPVQSSDTIKQPETNSVVEQEAKKDAPAVKEAAPSLSKGMVAEKKEPATETAPVNIPSAAPSVNNAEEKQDERIPEKTKDISGNVKNSQLKKSNSSDKKPGETISNDGPSDNKDQSTSIKTKALNEVIVSRNAASQNLKTNYFRGQVMDAGNSPLPFANVTIVPDNIGTYTDAKGNFVLISPDSALDVQIHSVGFENNSARLSNSVAGNSIVLQQDTKNVPVTVLNYKKINSDKRRKDTMTIEEPEPADGWYNYDTYIANNIKISDEIKIKTTPSSEVELSFDINKYGEPVNIKVARSVCKECDEEAIRLLKEGPKWKKKKRNKKAKMLVGFPQE